MAQRLARERSRNARVFIKGGDTEIRHMSIITIIHDHDEAPLLMLDFSTNQYVDRYTYRHCYCR